MIRRGSHGLQIGIKIAQHLMTGGKNIIPYCKSDFIIIVFHRFGLNNLDGYFLHHYQKNPFFKQSLIAGSFLKIYFIRNLIIHLSFCRISISKYSILNRFE